MTIDEKRKRECFAVDCKYAELACIVYHGNECIRLDGKRIPVQRSSMDYREPKQKPSNFKPWFMQGLPEMEVDL